MRLMLQLPPLGECPCNSPAEPLAARVISRPQPRRTPGWRIFNTLITPTLCQQILVAMASTFVLTVAPVIDSAVRAGRGGGDGGAPGAPVAANLTGT